MRLAHLLVVSGAILSLQCAKKTTELVSQSPLPTPTTPSARSCTASLSELGSFDRAFPEALLKDGTPCVTSQIAQERHCPGVYIAFSQGSGFGMSTRYFDGDHKLIGLFVVSDTNQYCNQTSFDITYGTRPACSTQEVVTDLCRR